MSEQPFMREGMHIDSDITLYEMSAGGGKMRIVNPVTLVAGVTYRIDYTEVGPGEVRVDAWPVARAFSSFTRGSRSRAAAGSQRGPSGFDREGTVKPRRGGLRKGLVDGDVRGRRVRDRHQRPAVTRPVHHRHRPGLNNVLDGQGAAARAGDLIPRRETVNLGHGRSP